ncbi:MAG: aminotransferase class III-fold pyridoxal phosphate-dependent enzyme [Planctomycetes bacterium]|nr:aminotransferase class III-fold pyridoxal phosphate-dependent enzyme [Planctomycetota bacterium]
MDAHLDRQHQFIPWSVQSTQDELVEIAGGQGVTFWDSRGNRYLDFLSQLFNVNLGHGNRRIIEAIQRQAEQFCAASASVMHAGRTRLAQRLAELTPGDLTKVFFTNSGSEANEIAFALARLGTGRQKIFAKYRSYHGTTLGTLTLCGDPRRLGLEPGPPGSVRFFDPYCYRCDFHLEYPSCGIHCARALEQQILLEGPETVAAVVVEPFTAAAGGFPLPPGYLRRVREICDRYGCLLIADEVICGFGRTGEWFAVNHEGVVPDILTLAKGITSGYVPMGAAVVRAKIAEHFETRYVPVGCTYTGHPLACAAALAALDEYEARHAVENARAMGLVLARGLAELRARHPCIGDVRSQGLFACIELVKDQRGREPLAAFNTSPPVVGEIRRQCLQRGLYLYNRWNLILLAPPLIIGEEDLRKGLAILDAVLLGVDAAIPS